MLNLYLASPRGFCAGVERAISIVEKAIEKYGAPIYVRHEIVHNKFVVDNLKKLGAVFVSEIDDIPSGAIVIFSAHGVSKAIEDNAKKNNLQSIDATCPLVTKVHLEARIHEKKGRKIILIGHIGHPEVEGTSGSVESEVYIVSNVEDVDQLKFDDSDNLAYITQTTLSVDDTRVIIAKLKDKFPSIIGPNLKNICYATQNRQNAAKKMTEIVDLILVIGASNSSNSNRLRDIGEEMGKRSYLINDYRDIKLSWFEGVSNIGVTAGASAPELLVNEVIEFLQNQFETKLHELKTTDENIKFNLPLELRD